jgi:HK97 family phage major capsid protein
MLKEKLMKMLKEKEERKAGLATKAKTTEDIAELRSINGEVETLNTEIAELRGMITDIETEEARATTNPLETQNHASVMPVDGQQARGQQGQIPGNLNPLGSFQIPQQRNDSIDDKFGTMEYRKAFMDYCVHGNMSQELRADAVTTSGDVSAVIPSTILNEVIKKVTSYGQIFNRVRKLNVKGGLTIPILSLKPTATWIGETSPSDKQKVQANTGLSFSYYGLECKISTSLLSDTVTLAGFEAVITDLIIEAMTKALDLAILKGTGTGQPLGIINDTRIPATQIVTIKSDEIGSWEAWKKKVFAKLPLSYKGGANFFMASGTFEGYIDGMVDSNGQPIGRVNYGIITGPQESFGGKGVVQVEDDIIAPYDDAAVGDVIGIYCNLNNYGFNSNMQMMMYRYFDNDKNEYVDKAILIADGKIIDPNGVVIIKKGA